MRYEAVIFDWAGTTVDFGSFAPMGVFVETFADFGIEVSIDEARAPMGLPKRAHIEAMLAVPRIAAAWRDTRGAAATQADVDALYALFVPKNETVAARYATLVPGTVEVMAALRARGLKIGSTTGYTRSIMAHVLPVAAAQGYSPDNLVCSDDLSEGRPGPQGMVRCCEDLGVASPQALIKVDDTVPGILEGVSAGALTVGVALSGNAVGLSVEALAALPAPEVDSVRKKAGSILLEAGADHVIDTIADLPDLLSRLDP